ncbi:serine hydrolase [Sphingomonas sp. MMS24-J13]|uniref:serine hydrolase n=1 Tax=Sphingomonas sp. MMS24-J13 TaxID=3238686 RepID=UPI00384DC459
MSGLTTSRRGFLGVGAGGAILAAWPAWAQATDFDEAAIDAIVQPFLAQFGVPGLAVAIVRPGKPDFAKGYGVRTLGRPGAVDAHTLFGIASNSKAFTAAALAMLVDEGKIGWDEPVIRYLPEFKMYDPAVTQMMTVRDLLVHRSGLGLGAGDLMQFPETKHSLSDILHGLQYLKPARGFRAGYAYDNILYLVAGMLITKISGLSWQDFVSARLLRPLGMDESVSTRSLIRTANVAGRHARLGPPLRGMGPVRVVQPDEQDKIAAAGGINASAHDITRWFHAQLAQGKLSDGKRLWSAVQAKEMWTPQTITGNSDGPTADQPQRPVLQAYALGWFVQDYRGHRLISHSGGLVGQVTQQALLPDLGCGLAVYTNTEDGAASVGLRNALLDRLVAAPPFDWVGWTQTRIAKSEKEAMETTGGGAPKPVLGGPSLPLDAYAGRYRNSWYGDIVVGRKAQGLTIDFTRTPAFRSRLEPWGQDMFRTRFADGVGEDAVVMFAVANGKVTGITMKPLSPLADFSFDFQDLVFVPTS